LPHAAAARANRARNTVVIGNRLSMIASSLVYR
jgi:hypothetical protein